MTKSIGEATNGVLNAKDILAGLSMQLLAQMTALHELLLEDGHVLAPADRAKLETATIDISQTAVRYEVERREFSVAINQTISADI